MVRHTFSLIAATMLLLAAQAASAGGEPDGAMRLLGSAEPAKVAEGAAALRGMGPDGLAAAIKQYEAHPSPALAAAIDAVAGQKDAVTSRLYWYTDLEQAKAAAKAAGKPILSLRLLGKLTDEYSCANSRFFRTVLYANTGVSKYLRENFILHWSSERPVPVITIDFGDGRVMKRTITGNSIHYVLNSNGEVVDALPGLYDPATFVRELRGAHFAAANAELLAGSLAAPARGGLGARSSYATRTEDQLLRQWQQRVATAHLAIAPMPGKKEPPNAAKAMGLATSKALIEMPMLRKVAPEFAAALDHDIDNAEAVKWEAIAAQVRPTVKLDEGSLALIRKQNPALDGSPEQLAKVVDSFERGIALDTVKNQFLFRRAILHWLAEGKEPMPMAALNQRVYAELFLTPRSDPWLGLAPGDAYSALTADGCTVAK